LTYFFPFLRKLQTKTSNTLLIYWNTSPNKPIEKSTFAGPLCSTLCKNWKYNNKNEFRRRRKKRDRIRTLRSDSFKQIKNDLLSKLINSTQTDLMASKNVYMLYFFRHEDQQKQKRVLRVMLLKCWTMHLIK
jgi:hypothetical protein